MSARTAEPNLLPKEAWEKGVVGQLLSWGLTAGRYVVVFTELIVIGAFLARFGLDRILTDLHASIKNQQSIIASFGDLEANFRLTQAKLDRVKQVSGRPLILSNLDLLSQISPQDAVFTGIDINQETMTLTGRVGSQAGLATLLNQTQNQPGFADVTLENVKSAVGQSEAIEFRLTLTLVKT